MVLSLFLFFGFIYVRMYFNLFQTREKGKSLLREIYKRRSSMDASGGATDLSGLDISPITLFQEPNNTIT